MKRVLLVCCLFGLNPVRIQAQSPEADEWNLAQAYSASSHVFYGELSKIIPEPDFKTGMLGVHIKEINQDELNLEAIVWPKAKEFTFTVGESFKQAAPSSFAVYLADPHEDIWTHVENATGDVFLAKPQTPSPLLAKLNPGDQGLYFVRYYVGSNLPVLYRVRLGRNAENDLVLLRAHRAAGNDVSIYEILRQAEALKAAIAKREAEEFKVFEDDYYKILRIQELEIRASLLNDLIERMDFEGLWTYYEFKERYLKQHGSHIGDSAVPSRPADGKEKLWHDISGELIKIEAIQKARTRSK